MMMMLPTTIGPATRLPLLCVVGSAEWAVVVVIVVVLVVLVIVVVVVVVDLFGCESRLTLICRGFRFRDRARAHASRSYILAMMMIDDGNVNNDYMPILGIRTCPLVLVACLASNALFVRNRCLSVL